jgi:hypothetical protein
MKRTFVEFAAVRRVLESEGISDDAIRLMQLQIMRGAGDVVQGTGGLRKIRCATPGHGKSGGIRVVFADYPEAGKCLLLAAFAKNVRGNLSRGEQNDLMKLKAALDRQMKTLHAKDVSNENKSEK